jgi:hypothetical protein
MGCCNNKNKMNNCNNERAELTDAAAWVINGLMDVVRTGRIPSLFKNAAADQLATMIANLVDENKYLRAIIGVMRPEMLVAENSFTIAFGPNKQYALNIPVTTDDERREIIANLRAAIEKLEAPPAVVAQQQLPLFS